jgi:hypothetical protein
LKIAIVVVVEGITRVPFTVVLADVVAASVVVIPPVVVAPVVVPVPPPVTVVPPPPPPPPVPPASPPPPPRPPVVVVAVPVEVPVVRIVVVPVPTVVVTPVPVITVVSAVPVREIPVVVVIGDVVGVAVGVVEDQTGTTIVLAFRTSDPTPVVDVVVVGATEPATLTTGELIDEVVLTVGSDGGEVTTLIEVITAHTVVVGLPERESAATVGADPFVVVTSA